MEKKELNFTKEECINEVRKGAFLFASLYYHFAKTLVDEFGEKKGKELIRKAVRSFAQERGEKLRQRAKKLGMEPNYENWIKVTDLPFAVPAWEVKEGKVTYCPYADVWAQKGAIGRELGFLYCDINDPVIYETYNSELKQTKWTGHLLWEPSTPCERVIVFKGKKVYPK